MDRIYFDNAATTMMKRQVLDEVMPYLTTHYGNASSHHKEGGIAAAAVRKSREQVASAIGANESQIYFTGSGTEADNWAIYTALNKPKSKGKHIITSTIEHHAILHTLKSLERTGVKVTYLPVDKHGLVSPAALEQAITEETCLVTIMFANNEVGTIQPIQELAAVAHKHGVLFHTDAVQAIGYVPIDVNELDVDMLTMAAHKFGGMKGVGALFVKRGKPLPYIHGGAQERGTRAGTTNVAGIVSMGSAIGVATQNMAEKTAKIASLRDYIVEQVTTRISHVDINGHPTQRLCNNASFNFAGIEGESIALSLDLKGIAVSTGSACSSDSLEVSHVLLAMGYPHENAQGSIRVTLCDTNTKEEADKFLDELIPIIERLRAMSPLGNIM